VADRPPFTRRFTAHDGETVECQIGPNAKLFVADKETWVIVPVRNIGTGVAILSGSPLLITVRNRGISVYGRASLNVIAPGDVCDFVFRIDGDTRSFVHDGDDPRPSALRMQAKYTDLAGRETTSYLNLGGVSGNQVELRSEGMAVFGSLARSHHEREASGS
jgi:hypothetical protein